MNTAGVSVFFMPAVVGQLNPLLNPDRWEGSEAEKYAATQAIEYTILRLLTEYEPPIAGGDGVLYNTIGQVDFVANSDGISLVLPALWRHVRLDLMLRGTGGTSNLGIRFDGDDVNPNYRFHDTKTTTTTAYNQGTWNRIPIRSAIGSSANPGGFFHKTVIDIYNPKAAGTQLMLNYIMSGYYQQSYGVGNWVEVPANPTTIDILPESGQIASGSELMIAIGEREP